MVKDRINVCVGSVLGQHNISNRSAMYNNNVKQNEKQNQRKQRVVIRA